MGSLPNRNFVRSVLAEGGVIKPLMISPTHSNGLGLCNPSVFIDGDEIWLILRQTNYTLYHCENGQTFNNRWGPLSYLNPENDLHLRTTNYLCKLTSDLDIEKYWKIDTSAFDKEPLWEFVGLEDARLVRWDGHLYGIGVRRDTTTNGQGRMELSELELSDDKVREIGRYRIEHPTNPEWYCEKNWMPVIDRPYHFIQWTNPAVLVKADISTLKSCHAQEPNEACKIEGLPFLRGSSQVIPWRDYYICLVHDCDLLKNRIGQKDATYMHRFVIYDRNWDTVRIGDQFSFLDGEIEFCCGMGIYHGDMLITFGFQDNCAFILRVPEKMIAKVLGIEIDWGLFNTSVPTIDHIRNEIFEKKVYERCFSVQAEDTVVDVGASIGPFIWSIRDRKARKIVAVEPDSRFLETLHRNIQSIKNVEIVERGISAVDGKFISRGLFSGSDPHSSVWEGEPTEIEGIRFSSLIREKGIERIDFLKTDCEGGEYNIFNDENTEWIKENIRHVAGEFHLYNKDLKEKWLHFRDTYLKALPFSIYSIDDINITKEVWLEVFANHYNAVMVYIDNPIKAKKWNSTKYPTLEITTAMPVGGCPMSCAFCPQDKIVSAYKGVRTLSYENFARLIDKVPKEIQITFAGFSEPFLNPDCAAMIRYAHNMGHSVSLFTTAMGMKLSDFECIRDIPFTGVQGGFVLHLPDKEGYFVEKKRSDYPELLRAIKQAKLSNFQAVTMGTLPDHLLEIFPDVIKQEMYWRAGNVSKVGTIKTDKKPPSTCNCQERLYHNVLMPNGDITLCCMDWSLKHVLGNLFTSNYEDIVPVDKTAFELCRYCENGVPI